MGLQGLIMQGVRTGKEMKEIGVYRKDADVVP
jgi:hypothetical protein